MPTGILKLKLGAADGMSRKKLRQWLADCCRQTNNARIAMQWKWMEWRKSHPDWQPGQRVDRSGQPKVSKDGKPLLEHQSCSQELAKLMYAYGREVSPKVNSKVLSQAWTDILQRLKSNTPYTHRGKARFVWQAILSHELPLSNFAALSMPVPGQDSCLFYRGHHSRKLSPGIVDRIERYAGHSAVLRFPVWSAASGHRRNDIICRVQIGKMSCGHRKLLAKIAAGEIKFSDSEIVERGGKWFLHLCYSMPTTDHGLDPERQAVLTMGRDRMFCLTFPDGRRWNIGDDRPVIRECERITLRRKTIRYRSRNNPSGHGKQRFYSKVRPFARRFLDMQDEYRNQLLADLVKACIKNNCGSLLYREPSKPLREKSTLAIKGVPFNWSEFLPMLKFKCELNHISLNTERMKYAEWQEAGTARDAVPSM